NEVSISGGGAFTTSTQDLTPIIVAPALSITKKHIGNFVQGQTGATYTLLVTNGAGANPTSGTVTVTESLPSGLTLVAMGGTGWTSAAGGNPCTRPDVLAPGASFPAIAVTVNVAANAAPSLVSSASVSGGGSAPAATSDSTTILPSFGDVSSADF